MTTLEKILKITEYFDQVKEQFTDAQYMDIMSTLQSVLNHSNNLERQLRYYRPEYNPEQENEEIYEDENEDIDDLPIPTNNIHRIRNDDLHDDDFSDDEEIEYLPADFSVANIRGDFAFNISMSFILNRSNELNTRLDYNTNCLNRYSDTLQNSLFNITHLIWKWYHDRILNMTECPYQFNEADPNHICTASNAKFYSCKNLQNMVLKYPLLLFLIYRGDNAKPKEEIGSIIVNNNMFSFDGIIHESEYNPTIKTNLIKCTGNFMELRSNCDFTIEENVFIVLAIYANIFQHGIFLKENLHFYSTVYDKIIQFTSCESDMEKFRLIFNLLNINPDVLEIAKHSMENYVNVLETEIC